MRVCGVLTLASSMLIGGAGCVEKDNPLWMLESGGGSGGGSSGGTATSTTTTTTTITTSQVSESGGGGCPLEFSAAFDGSDDFRSDTPWTYNGSAEGPTCPFGLSIVSFDGMSFREGDFELDVTVDSLCEDGPGVSGYRGAGVMARLGNTLNCSDLQAMYCIMNVQLQQVELGTSDANCNGEMHPRDVAVPDVNFAEGQSYTIRLEINGNDARCTVGRGTSSEVEVRLDDFGVVPSIGTVGFWAESAEVTVSSFRACGR